MRKRASWFSLAVAVTTRCDGSVAVYSVEAVKEAGRANRRGTRVAVAMNAGTAVVFSARVLDALDTVDGAISVFQFDLALCANATLSVRSRQQFRVGGVMTALRNLPPSISTD
jgi:hypothetical protein